MVACTTTVFAATVDFQAHGFPNVAAEALIPVGVGATLQAGGAKVTIPAGAFSDPVKFEILQGPLVSFDAKAPEGQTSIFDFAFKVIDEKTGALVASFGKPVVFSYTNRNVNVQSMYYNIGPTGMYTLNPVKPTISVDTLTHGITGASVGWVITSPCAEVKDQPRYLKGFPTLSNISTDQLGLSQYTSFFVFEEDIFYALLHQWRVK
ncbi:hypothetical protein [Alicyclobacillus ferrooxydans]|uniref:hypothetical protein n=1 Tax=Alicyclobacillus ferrooxydans TaxID=471514 RepID=UPI0006D52DDF|nr:hypothetical protein [Alicyclobacillus ferrooxydans]